MNTLSGKAATILSLLLVALIARLQFNNWAIAHHGNLSYLVDAAQGVLEGTPHWRAFQNRLLSPALVHMLGWVSSQPLLLFTQLWMLALNVGLFCMVRHLTRSHLLGLLAVVGAALMWVLEPHNSSYTWDLTEAACLLVLAFFATRPVPLAWMLALFVVAAFNRESAVFIGLYLMVCGVMMWACKQTQASRTMLWGVVLASVSVVLTEVLRKTLFTTSALRGVGDDAAHAVFENHIHIGHNVALLQDLVHQASPLLFILALYGMSLLVVIQRGLVRQDARLVGAGVSLAAYLASLGVFGVLDELRLYQPLNWCLPLLLIASLVPRAAAPGALTDTGHA